MSGDAFKTVRPGDPLQFPAELYNTLVQMAVAYKGGRFPVGRTPRGVSLAPGWAFAYNASGEAAPAYALVELIERATTSRQIEFVKPGDEDGVGAYGITLEPIASEGVGIIAVAGGPHTLRVSAGVVGDYLGADDGEWAATTETGGPLVMVGDIVTEGGVDYCLAVFAAGQTLYTAGTHIAISAEKVISEAGTRADATQALVVETRTSDPGSPATGRIWLRTDL